MKYLFFLVFATSFISQLGLVAQSNSDRPVPQIEVKIQELPSSNEGAYYDNSQSPPQIRSDFNQDSRRIHSYPSTQNKSTDKNRVNRDNNGDDEDDNTTQQNRKSSISQPYSTERSNRVNSPLVNSIPKENIERTLSILKPDAVKNRHIGEIISRFEDQGLRVIGIKMVRLDQEQAAQFYKVHRERPFFKDLIQFMSSGPIVILVLEGNQAVNKNRQLMGATDPTKAQKGTIRSDYAESITQNAVHGSDSQESAREEISFFFKPNELYSSY